MRDTTPAPFAAPSAAFLADLGECDHCVQFYESDAVFLDALESFAVGAIVQGEAVIVIATAAHRTALEARLLRRGVDLGTARARDQFIALDAGETLQRFMVHSWPDEALFEQLVTGLLARARIHHRKVRAFGEMVALMWAAGHCEATVRLEQMWTRLCERETFSMFCAYPKTGFAEDVMDRLEQVCSCHSKVYIL
jgi:KaiC/GvpD/RAD55 family RecA-like ATPase